MRAGFMAIGAGLFWLGVEFWILAFILPGAGSVGSLSFDVGIPGFVLAPVGAAIFTYGLGAN